MENADSAGRGGEGSCHPGPMTDGFFCFCLIAVMSLTLSQGMSISTNETILFAIRQMVLRNASRNSCIVMLCCWAWHPASILPSISCSAQSNMQPAMFSSMMEIVCDVCRSEGQLLLRRCSRKARRHPGPWLQRQVSLSLLTQHQKQLWLSLLLSTLCNV